jgi:hypothetical protein
VPLYILPPSRRITHCKPAGILHAFAVTSEKERGKAALVSKGKEGIRIWDVGLPLDYRVIGNPLPVNEGIMKQ